MLTTIHSSNWHVRDTDQTEYSVLVWNSRGHAYGEQNWGLGWFVKDMVLKLVNTFSLHSHSLLFTSTQN